MKIRKNKSIEIDQTCGYTNKFNAISSLYRVYRITHQFSNILEETSPYIEKAILAFLAFALLETEDLVAIKTIVEAQVVIYASFLFFTCQLTIVAKLELEVFLRTKTS